MGGMNGPFLLFIGPVQRKKNNSASLKDVLSKRTARYRSAPVSSKEFVTLLSVLLHSAVCGDSSWCWGPHLIPLCPLAFSRTCRKHQDSTKILFPKKIYKNLNETTCIPTVKNTLMTIKGGSSATVQQKRTVTAKMAVANWSPPSQPNWGKRTKSADKVWHKEAQNWKSSSVLSCKVYGAEESLPWHPIA